VRDFVDVGDLERQKGIGSVLDHLGRGQVTGEERHGAEAFRAGQAFRRGEVLVEQGAVEIGEGVEGLLVLGADDDAVGIEGVKEGRALTQELGVGDDGVVFFGFLAVFALVGGAHERADPVA